MSDYIDCLDEARYVCEVFGEEEREVQAIGAMIQWGKQVWVIEEKVNRLVSVQWRGTSLCWAHQEGVADKKLQELIKSRELKRTEAEFQAEKRLQVVSKAMEIEIYKGISD